MSDYYRIRLRDPWQREPLSHSVRFHRTFHRPTGLEPTTQIELVLDQVHVAGDLYLNDEHLGSFVPDSQPVRFHILDPLESMNNLDLIANTERIDPSGRTRVSDQQLKSLECLVDEVRLEIREYQ